jgi:thiosulfate/3-mercaptopyruvate sulfurtransferase
MIPAMPPAFVRPELLASVDWVAEHIPRASVRVLDCRWRPDSTAHRLFADAHIPGAVFLDWMTDLVDPEDPTPLQLAGPERFAAAMSRAGVGDGTSVVCYDDTGSLYASRVWWSLQTYGCASARVLDGGWPAWVGSGRPSTTAQLAPEPVTFTPRLDPRRRLSTSDLRGLVGSSDVDLVDARGPADFAGQQGDTARLGRLPASVNVPAATVTAEDGQHFLQPDALAAIFAHAGLSRGRRVIVYDATGIGASKVALALALVGYSDVAVYDAGWAEWGPRMDLPLNR